MILAHFKRSAQKTLEAWSRAKGLESAPPLILTPAPGHVAADVSLPWPMAAAKELARAGVKSKPLDAAGELALLLRGAAGVESAVAAPPGFVNVLFTRKSLTDNLTSLLTGPGRYGAEAPAEPRKILLEFVSANPTGPVHLASGRAAALGDSLARILRWRGHEARTEYYVNDSGRQVELLGLSVKARYDELKGKESALPNDGYQGSYVMDIAREAPAEASSWEPGRFSRFAVERMLAEHQADMESYGVRFDRWYRETELHERGALAQTLAKLKESGRTAEKDGAVWLSSSNPAAEDDKDRVLVRSDGRATYFLADIAYHQDKLDRGHKELIDIWGADHHGYVPRMTDAIAALGCPKTAFQPIVHQLVHLFRGDQAVKMSKRAGEFITLRELVQEAGLDACRFFFSMRTANSHMSFDIDLARKKSQENPVYYVQYVHARVASIFREALARSVCASPAGPETLALLVHPAERALLLKLAWFPEVLGACERELSPHPVPNYLMELAGLFHKFYEACHVLDAAKPDLTAARLALCSGVGKLIADALELIGVSAPETM